MRWLESHRRLLRKVLKVVHHVIVEKLLIALRGSCSHLFLSCLTSFIGGIFWSNNSQDQEAKFMHRWCNVQFIVQVALRTLKKRWFIAPCKDIWIPECRECLLAQSIFHENFACGMWSPGLWNPESLNDYNPESKFHWQRIESTTWNPESTVWNPEFQSSICLHGARFRS